MNILIEVYIKWVIFLTYLQLKNAFEGRFDIAQCDLYNEIRDG
jgi:hypothetical protein